MSGSAPSQTTPLAPANTSVVTTQSPVLQISPATDPEGDPLQYWYRIATQPGANSGTLIDSGWWPFTSWNPQPSMAAVLQEGVTYYYWNVYVSDGTTNVVPNWAWSFTVDLRGGERASGVIDEVGSVRVNLSTRGVVAGYDSRGFGGVGGAVGASFRYNSFVDTSSNNGGLTGRYYADTNQNRAIDPGEAPRMVRRDPQIDFHWLDSSPNPASVPADNFLVRWSGNLIVPTWAASGNYRFGATHDDGVRITINGVTVLDRWFDQHSAVIPNYGDPIGLLAGQSVPIQVDLYENAGDSLIALFMDTPIVGSADELVPSDWLADTLAPHTAMAHGWSMAAGASPYRAAVASDRGVTLFDVEGGSHPYRWTGSGYAPPPGESEVVATDSNGLLTVHSADGSTSVFDAAGQLASFRAAGAEETSQAAPVLDWGGGTRLQSVQDPVSGRTITFNYGCGGVPAGKLCSLSYWDGTTTTFTYEHGMHLARIIEPGNEVTEFAFTENYCKLVGVRDATTMDAVASGAAPNDAASQTVISYSSFENGRVSGVTLPAPAAGAPRPAHTYNAVSPTDVRVSVAGLAQPLGYARRATFNGLGQILTDTDATGLTTAYEWAPGTASCRAPTRRGARRPPSTTAPPTPAPPMSSARHRPPGSAPTAGPPPPTWPRSPTPRPSTTRA